MIPIKATKCDKVPEGPMETKTSTQVDSNNLRRDKPAFRHIRKSHPQSSNKMEFQGHNSNEIDREWDRICKQETEERHLVEVKEQLASPHTLITSQRMDFTRGLECNNLLKAWFQRTWLTSLKRNFYKHGRPTWSQTITEQYFWTAFTGLLPSNTLLWSWRR